jgi:phosphomannomutase
MPPKFGTSGLRGLVTELTPDLISDYTRAFLAACPHGGAVHVGWDLRPSSPDIAQVVIAAVQAAGLRAVQVGAVPTPALALGSMGAGHAAIMITGSHIPADRNGLKFYVPGGEVSKEDEAAINARLGGTWDGTANPAPVEIVSNTAQNYIDRYVTGFGPTALQGLTIGIYEHSSVARDILGQAVAALGGTPVSLARSDIFIPVDTEAVDPATRSSLAAWCAENGLDALISTDGDADRPMMADAAGNIVPGDVLGALTAAALGARVICTPVSSNSMIAAMPMFGTINRTRIGSPFVIAAMEAVLATNPAATVVGYEANGGFLLGFEAQGPAGPIAPLATRDCLLPLLAPLADAKARGISLAELVATLPPVFTAADRVAEVPSEKSGAFIAELIGNPDARAAFFDTMGPEDGLDLTDGLRLRFASGAVVHLRPSGNAPECRCYAEAGTAAEAAELVTIHLSKLKAQLTA